MRRRQAFSMLNPRDNRAPVPSGAGMGAAAVTPPPSPVSRAEEEASAFIWKPDRTKIERCEYVGEPIVLTPSTDPTAAPLVKRRGWPKGKKRKP